jgi:hypothetical protein
MATHLPLPQPIKIKGIPKVTLKGPPHLWQMILSLVAACIVLIGGLVGLGKLYLDRTEASSNAAAKEREARIKLHQAQFQVILRSIVENKNTKLTNEEKQRYSSLLQDISYEDVKSLLDGLRVNSDRRDLDVLKNNNEVEPGEKVTDLQWNNGSPAQIRFFKRKNMSLDFQKIDVYSAPPDSCSSKVIPLGDSSTATVQICESHLSQKLELIVIQNSE